MALQDEIQIERDWRACRLLVTQACPYWYNLHIIKKWALTECGTQPLVSGFRTSHDAMKMHWWHGVGFLAAYFLWICDEIWIITLSLILILFIFLILSCFLLILLFLFLLLFLILSLLLLLHLLMLLLLSPWFFTKYRSLLYNYWISQWCSTFSSASSSTDIKSASLYMGYQCFADSTGSGNPKYEPLLSFSPLMQSYDQEMFFVFLPWFTAIFIFKYFNFIFNNLIMGARIAQSM